MPRTPLRLLAAAAVVLTTVAPTAAALELEIDPSGGPLVLEDEVRAALAAWAEAGVDVDALDRRVVVRYGAPDLLGPDVPVLVRVAPGGGVELLVHPGLQEAVPAALPVAIGIALGAPAGTGATATPMVPGEAFVPDAAAAAEVEAARERDPADLNRDGVVDFEDLLILAERFGQRGLNLLGDLDGDGVVDERDVALLRERYEFTPPSRAPPPAAPAVPDGPDELPEVPEAEPDEGDAPAGDGGASGS